MRDVEICASKVDGENIEKPMSRLSGTTRGQPKAANPLLMPGRSR